MKANLKEIEINGELYVPKSSIKENTTATNTEGMKYCVIRGDRSGVFVGYVKSIVGQNVELINSRRLYYWDGACSISEIAMKGVSKPENCKFPCEVPTHILTDVIEVIEATEESRKSIEGVSIWTKF